VPLVRDQVFNTQGFGEMLHIKPFGGLKTDVIACHILLDAILYLSTSLASPIMTKTRIFSPK
jgi:hypothetical protein